MDNSAGAIESYTFGSFELFPEQRLLLDDGRTINLGSRALDVLIVLVESAGETVSTARIMARAWPTTTVDKASVRVHMSVLRKMLGDGRDGNRFIANISGRGYAFVAPIRRRQVRAPAASSRRAPTGNLPPPMVGIVGRSDTIAGLAAQLSRCRLLTIVGMGGIGKTTVALAVADRVAASYPDGAWFIALASLPVSDVVSSAVATALGVAATGADPLAGLADWLRDKQALIVLDNCEHVINAAAVVAETILKAAPRVTILATSREPLRTEVESLHRLKPLETPPAGDGIAAADALAHAAVELFNERAQMHGIEFAITDANASRICEICRRLDGLPLALELAAAHLAAFGIEDLARGLENRFTLLTKGHRTALRRQQTLRATMDWSHDLLPETERIVLRRLAVFRGNFTMAVAATITSDVRLPAHRVIEGIVNLAMKSLVTSKVGGAVTYFRLLETTRAYALERLRESGEWRTFARRHTECQRDLLSNAGCELAAHPSHDWLSLYVDRIDD